MLALDTVTLTYPDGASRLTAIDRVSLRVDQGESVAIIGPSGSGKSSLLSVAATLTRPDSGKVLIGDFEVTGLSRGQAADIRRTRLGIVFQNPNLIGSLTVRDQLQIKGKMSGTTISDETIDELLDEVGVLQTADRYPSQLSGGQRQRVNIARALVGSPSVLLVDEPTSALDKERGLDVMRILKRVTTDHEVATVVVTHEREHVSFFDAAYHMLDGRLTPVVDLADVA